MMKNIQVIKIGASSVIQNSCVNQEFLDALACDVQRMAQEDIHSLLVVSGAIRLGMLELGYAVQPSELAGLQRCAGVGQPLLIQEYQRHLKKYNLISSQLLVTYHNLEDRAEEENIVRRLRDDVDNGIITLINYNDGIDSRGIGIYDQDGKIRIRDNDMLATAITKYICAKRLVMITNPQSNGTMGGGTTKKEAIRVLNEKGIEVIVGECRRRLYDICNP